MPPRCRVMGTLTPFLYPSLEVTTARRASALGIRLGGQRVHQQQQQQRHRHESSRAESAETIPEYGSHLNPMPTDYSRTIFADTASLTIHAGNGGHGCISFLREKYIADGPANGGDGGTGGNIYIQATRGETSLHKLARRREIKAGRGRNGQGKTKGGERGEDVVIQVPVGTIIREMERFDPVSLAEDQEHFEALTEGPGKTSTPYKWDRDKWMLYPAITPEDIATAEFPTFPKSRRSPLASSQAKAPIALDLSVPMEKPVLLAAGAVGGLGNPHFVTRTASRPKYATKGDIGVRITLKLELKLLADVGLVGLPNAGKSTLLRSVSNSRTRIGNWAFTTLSPNIGTVVLDDHRGRPLAKSFYETGEQRTNLTIADIPGLIAGAHLDKGLGISFLRHVERAKILAFVIDLSAGDAVTALKALWNEVGAYERMKQQEEKAKRESIVSWRPQEVTATQHTIIDSGPDYSIPVVPRAPSIVAKPWFVVATKADLPGTQDNHARLGDFLADVSAGVEPHPSGQTRTWTGVVQAIPISAINGHGVDKITECTLGLLNEG